MIFIGEEKREDLDKRKEFLWMGKWVEDRWKK